MTSAIDYRDNCWFIITPHGDFGCWTLAAAMSFTVNNLGSNPTLTNRALVQKYRQ
jgi:hypothetical protein